MEINPYDAEGHYNLATLIDRAFKDNDNARQHYETAINLQPNFVDAKHNYGMLLISSFSLFDKAKKQFLVILEIEHDKKIALKQIAKLFEEHYKNLNEAKLYNDRFILIKPNEAVDHYWYSTFLILHFLPECQETAKLHYDIACKMDISYKVETIDMLFRQ